MAERPGTTPRLLTTLRRTGVALLATVLLPVWVAWNGLHDLPQLLDEIGDYWGSLRG